MARLAASVQGVVVQIMNETAAFRACSSVTRPISIKRPDALVRRREVDEDAGRRDVLVFQLRLGQGRLAADAPVDRLELLVDQALAHQLGEDLQNARLIRRA